LQEIENDFRVAGDNISIDDIQQSSSSALPVANGQSDRDIVHLVINITSVITANLEWTSNKINGETIVQLQFLLKNSMLESSCKSKDSKKKGTSLFIYIYIIYIYWELIFQLNTSTQVLLLKFVLPKCSVNLCALNHLLKLPKLSFMQCKI
jgi:S-adenosylmethionine:tRNA-ribosyltransferase-isomerase (queuine synthetase)